MCGGVRGREDIKGINQNWKVNQKMLINKMAVIEAREEGKSPLGVQSR